MSEETGGDSGRPLEHLWNLQQVDTRLAAARARRSALDDGSAALFE